MPSIMEITCLRSHEPRLFRLVKTYVSVATGGNCGLRLQEPGSRWRCCWEGGLTKVIRPTGRMLPWCLLLRALSGRALSHASVLFVGLKDASLPEARSYAAPAAPGAGQPAYQARPRTAAWRSSENPGPSSRSDPQPEGQAPRSSRPAPRSAPAALRSRRPSPPPDPGTPRSTRPDARSAPAARAPTPRSAAPAQQRTPRPRTLPHQTPTTTQVNPLRSWLRSPTGRNE